MRDSSHKDLVLPEFVWFLSLNILNIVIDLVLCNSVPETRTKGCNITPRTSIGNISSISELIQPFPRSVYAEIDENSRNEVPMDVRGVVLQCLNKIWDIHPIMPIVKASGGIISTWKNEDAVKAGNIILSSNNTIHGKMLKLLKPALK